MLPKPRCPAKTCSTSATVAELTTAVSAVSAAALAISELTTATTKRTAAECGETNDSDAIGEPKWGRNSNNLAVAGHQEHVPKKSRTLLTGHSTLSVSARPDFPLTPNGTLLILLLK
jgi:hypothetical protein